MKACSRFPSLVNVVVLVSTMSSMTTGAFAFLSNPYPPSLLKYQAHTTTLSRTSSSSSSSITSMTAASDDNNNDKESSSSSSMWDQFQKFWEENAGGGPLNNNNSNRQDQTYDDIGLYQIASLPVQSIKPGGLRLFLMLYLMGMQNTPQPKTWRAHQPTTTTPTTTAGYDNNDDDDDANNNKHVLEMYFHDQTALFRVRLLPTAVVLERQGPTPSTAYLMQETQLVDGVWNELQVLATEGDVPDQNRLVQLSQPQAQSAMDQAREALSFG